MLSRHVYLIEVFLVDFREKIKAFVQQKRDEKYQRGKQVREQREKEKTAQRENEVQNLEVSVPIAQCGALKIVCRV